DARIQKGRCSGHGGRRRRKDYRKPRRAKGRCYTARLRARQALERDSRTAKGHFSMYAVIKAGGKQYKVAAGEKIKVEQIAADIGQEITIEQVLAVGDGAELKVGAPWVAGASVKATVVSHGKHDKVRI